MQGVRIHPLKLYSDDRGFLTEILRCDREPFTQFGQSTLTMSYPGVIKAYHHHKIQTDHWVVVKGALQCVLYDLREDSKSCGETMVVYLHDREMKLLTIPPGVAHGYRVLGSEPALLLYHTTEPYRPEAPDEYRIPWDSPIVGFDWSTEYR